MGRKYIKYTIPNPEILPDAHMKKTMDTKGAAREYVDCDYLDKLSTQEKKWFLKFIDEYYYDNISKITPLHTNSVVKKLLYSDNNARRRSINRFNAPVQMAPNYSNPSPEDALIEAIDKCPKKG